MDSLCKTAQLNVNELLKYLNTENFKQEQADLAQQQRTCGAFMLNVRPRQHWITGPKKSVQRELSNITENNASEKRGDSVLKKLNTESPYGMTTAHLGRGSTIHTNKGKKIQFDEAPGDIHHLLDEPSTMDAKGRKNKRMSKFQFPTMRGIPVKPMPNSDLQSGVLQGRKRLPLGSTKLSPTRLNRLKKEKSNVFSGSLTNSGSIADEAISTKKRIKRKSTTRNQFQVSNKNELSDASIEEPEPVLLVTRKKTTLKMVPVDPVVQPYDHVPKKGHIKSLLNTQNRRRWQSLIEKDLINPQAEIASSARPPSSAFPENMTAPGLKQGAFSTSLRPSRGTVDTKSTSNYERRMDQVRRKYTKYAEKKLQIIQRAATAYTQQLGVNSLPNQLSPGAMPIFNQTGIIPPNTADFNKNRDDDPSLGLTMNQFSEAMTGPFESRGGRDLNNLQVTIDDQRQQAATIQLPHQMNPFFQIENPSNEAQSRNLMSQVVNQHIQQESSRREEREDSVEADASYNPHEPGKKPKKFKDYLKNERKFFQIQEKIRKNSQESAQDEEAEPLPDEMPKKYPEGQEEDQFNSNCDNADYLKMTSPKGISHLNKNVKSTEFSLQHTAAFEDPVHINVQQQAQGAHSFEKLSHPLSKATIHLRGNASIQEEDEETGYPRSKIHSQDQKRVDKYLKKQETIKETDPIMRFTQYQSYKQLKSGQSNYHQTSAKSQKSGVNSGTKLSSSKTALNQIQNYYQQSIPLQKGATGPPSRLSRGSGSHNRDYATFESGKQIGLDPAQFGLFEKARQASLGEDRSPRSPISNPAQVDLPQPPSSLPKTPTPTSGQNGVLTFENIHIQQNMETRRSQESPLPLVPPRVDVHNYVHMPNGFNVNQFKKSKKERVIAQALSDHTEGGLYQQMYRLQQEQSPQRRLNQQQLQKQLIEKQFNVAPVDERTENLLNVQLHNFPNLMKNVDGGFPSQRRWSQAVGQSKKKAAISRITPLQRHMDTFRVFKERQKDQLRMYTVCSTENQALQDRRNLVTECVGCVKRETKFKLKTLEA